MREIGREEGGWVGERKAHELCTVWCFISFIRKPHDYDSHTHAFSHIQRIHYVALRMRFLNTFQLSSKTTFT